MTRSKDNLRGYFLSITELDKLKPNLWLPATSVIGQNANLYDGEWKRLIEDNLICIKYIIDNIQISLSFNSGDKQMRSLIRVFLAFLICVGMAAGAVIWLLDLAPAAWRRTERPGPLERAPVPPRAGANKLLGLERPRNSRGLRHSPG